VAAKNDITGDAIKSKAATKKYEDGWDRIFGSKDRDLAYESENPTERPYDPGQTIHPAETRYPKAAEKFDWNDKNQKHKQQDYTELNGDGNRERGRYGEDLT